MPVAPRFGDRRHLVGGGERWMGTSVLISIGRPCSLLGTHPDGSLRQYEDADGTTVKADSVRKALRRGLAAKPLRYAHTVAGATVTWSREL